MKATHDGTPRTIGDVAQACGVPAHVLRHWENVGLLRPRRDATGSRRYDVEDLNRIAVIVLGKQMEAGLVELRHALDTDPASRRAVLESHHTALGERIAALRTAQEFTRQVIDLDEAGDAAACVRFEEAIVQTVQERATALR